MNKYGWLEKVVIIATLTLSVCGVIFGLIAPNNIRWIATRHGFLEYLVLAAWVSTAFVVVQRNMLTSESKRGDEKVGDGMRRQAALCTATGAALIFFAVVIRFLPQLVPKLSASIFSHGVLDSSITLGLAGVALVALGPLYLRYLKRNK